MSYLICDHCDVYYEIHSKGVPEESSYCDCGNKLKYFESLEDYFKGKGKIKNKHPAHEKLLEQLLKAYESIIAKMILCCVKQLPFNMGVQKLIDVLRGSRSTFILENDLHYLSSYSIFSNFNKESLEAMINYLTYNDYLEIIANTKHPEWPTLQITDIGEKFMSSGESIKHFLVEENVRKRIPPYDEVLYHELLEQRKIIAKERNIPVNQVCINNILLKLARHKPSEPDSMLNINGIGKIFMENYSSYFLNQINKYKRR